VLARILEDKEFISITLGLALFTQLSSFTLAIVALTIGISKQRDDKKPRETIEKLQTVITHLFLILLAFFLITAPLYFQRLQIDGLLLVPISLMLFLSLVMSVISGYLNGKKKLVKLGIVLACSSGLQLILCGFAALIFKSGFAALNAMAFGAGIAIATTYVLYKDENLPRFYSVFIHKLDIYKQKNMRDIIKFAILSSISVLVINILVILDLLVINSRRVDAKLYTDIYVISRVVFFSGILFVWPFLSNINIVVLKQNNKLVLRLFGVFILLGVLSLVLMYAFASQLTNIFLGSQYPFDTNLKYFTLMAVIYKLIYLFILTLTLYFIVIRNYWGIILPILLLFINALLLWLIGSNANSITTLNTINAGSFVGLIVGLIVFKNINDRA
jgi:O-antigen/teichoic acid export membrane protein